MKKLGRQIFLWLFGSAAVIVIAALVLPTAGNPRLRLAPCGMGVSKIAYTAEESWGLPFFPLPGDNETGVIVFDLPDHAVEKLETQGLEYLRGLRCPPRENEPNSWMGRFAANSWHRTPMQVDALSGYAWGDSAPPKIANYLNRYGFGIPINHAVEAAINDAISSPGSFFAYGRIGIIIVAPVKRQAFYAYAG